MQREQEYQRLPDGFYHQTTRQVARQLLGKTLTRRTSNGQVLRGIVVEAEAYLSSGDAASHSFRGPGKKNASMYLEPGKLYVYPYGNQFVSGLARDHTAGRNWSFAAPDISF